MQGSRGADLSFSLPFFPPCSARTVSHDQVYPTLLLCAPFLRLCVCVAKKTRYCTRPSTNHRDTRPNFLSLNVQPRRVRRPRADDNRFPFPRVRFDVEINTEDYSVSSFFSIVQADSSSRNSLSLVDRNLGVFPPRKVSGRGRNSSLPVETCKL